MSEDQRPPTYAELAALVEQLREANRRLEARVAELESRLGMNPRNSSKPPSSEGLSKPPVPKSLRGKSRRKPGGQAGHQGRTLERVADPDRVVVHRPAGCGGCGSDLGEADVVGIEARQVFDLPPVKPEVTEHRLVQCQCDCGTVTRAVAPSGVAAPVQYGPNLAAVVVYLYEGQFLSKERTAQAMSELFGCPVSTGTVETMANRAMAVIEASPFQGLVVAILQRVARLHVDETGLRAGGRLAWLHVATCEEVCLFLAHGKRGVEAMEAMDVLAEAVGVVHRDAWAPYDAFDITSQLCGAHLLREFQGVCDRAEDHRAGSCWACAAADALRDAKRLVDAALAEGLEKSQVDQVALAEAGHHFTSAAWLGRSETRRRRTAAEKKANALAGRMIDRFGDYWRFTHDPWGEFDNNFAEREIRMTKIKQKVSGGLRTLKGAERYALLRSYLHSARKNGLSFLQALKLACAGTPWLPTTTS